MRSGLHKLGSVGHWACKRHGTINRLGSECAVCKYDASVDPSNRTGRPSRSIAFRFGQAIGRLINRCRDAADAVADALGQW